MLYSAASTDYWEGVINSASSPWNRVIWITHRNFFMLCWLKEMVCFFHQITITKKGWKYIGKIRSQCWFTIAVIVLDANSWAMDKKNYWIRGMIENQHQFLNKHMLCFTKNHSSIMVLVYMSEEHSSAQSHVKVGLSTADVYGFLDFSYL